VAKAARRQATSPRQRAINKRAIRQLRSASETFSGTDLAKEARALERALASTNPNKPTTQRRLQSFVQAAAKQGSPRPTPKTLKRVSKAASKKAARTPTATPGLAKRAQGNTRVRYQTAIFRCWDDYQTCCQHNDWRICAAWLAICTTNQLKALGSLGLGPAAYIGIKHLIGH
jgi:hypothetical protein